MNKLSDLPIKYKSFKALPLGSDTIVEYNYRVSPEKKYTIEFILIPINEPYYSFYIRKTNKSKRTLLKREMSADLKELWDLAVEWMVKIEKIEKIRAEIRREC